MIKLTEITSRQGDIAKKYIIDGEEVETISAPTIYDGIAKQIELEFKDVTTYLDSLASDPKRCILLGVHGELGKEYKVTTEAKLRDGYIARTLKFFKWNTDAVTLLLLDFDLNVTLEYREEFLSLLDTTLKDALTGDSKTELTKICRWYRPSTSASVSINGKTGSGLHVFIPVKGDPTGIVKLIHRFCWLRGGDQAKSIKVSEAGNLSAQSLIDPAVGSSERVIYTSDAIVTGDKDKWNRVKRSCTYSPGGIIDAEIALTILESETLDFDRESEAFKSIREDWPEIRKIRTAWIEKQAAFNEKNGMDKETAYKAAASMTRGLLLSSALLSRVGGEYVSVRDILECPDDWMGEKRFNDPIKNEINRNVAMIIGTPENPKLRSFSHGGVIYELKWTFEDLSDWLENASSNEIDDWYAIHVTNADMSETKLASLHKVASRKTDANLKAIKDDIKKAFANKKESQTMSNVAKRKVFYGAKVSENASHGDILEDYIRNSGDCKTYGGCLYVWEDGSIWKEHSLTWIKKNLRTYYNHVDKCQRKSDYDGLSKMIVFDSDVNVQTWKEEYGFPCSDGFYLVGKQAKEGIEKIPYSKELGCRYKMGIKPDYTMKTPFFDKILENVENKVLYQQLFGLALSGYLNKMQKVFLMKGGGGDGKGTTCDIMTAMLPANRVTSIALKDLNHEYYKAGIAQSKVNFISETRQMKIDLTGVKEITGGGLITGRHPSGQVFNFYAQCSFVLAVNDMFTPEHMGRDIQRRFGHSMVIFNKRSSDKGEIEGLSQSIIENELPGILAWAMEGVRSYFAYGLDDTFSLYVYNRWCSDADPVQLFLNESYDVDVKHEGKSVTRSAIWDKFKVFCEDSKIKALGKHEFYSRVEKDPIIGEAKKSNGIYRYFNIAPLARN